MDDWRQLSDSLNRHRPQKKWWRFVVKRSAVAMILRQGAQGLEVLMIKRAEFEGDPWSGHMAFPGGRFDRVDRNSLATARRETWEEIGFDTHAHCQILTRLSDVTARTRHGPRAMVVTPYLFQANRVPELVLDEKEVADVLWIPLQHFASHQNRQSMQWQVRGRELTLPCYFYRQQRIWGLSLTMLDELLLLMGHELQR